MTTGMPKLGCVNHDCDKCQALEQPDDAPVAWMYDWEAEGQSVKDWVSKDYDEAHSPTMGCHNIRPLYIQPQPLAVERERNFCERCGKRLGVAGHIHTCTPPQPDDEHDELFCWKVKGVSSEYTGYYAEEEAKAVAKRIGGTCFAFPLYVRPQQKTEWVGLTDGDRQAAFESMPDMLEGFMKKWGWLHFSKAIEANLKEKNT